MPDWNPLNRNGFEVSFVAPPASSFLRIVIVIIILIVIVIVIVITNYN